MSDILFEVPSTLYTDITNRTNVELVSKKGTNNHVLVFKSTGGSFSAGTVTVRCKEHNSTRFLPLRDKNGVAVTIDLATQDSIAIDRVIEAVQFDVVSMAGATGWQAFLLGVTDDEIGASGGGSDAGDAAMYTQVSSINTQTTAINAGVGGASATAASDTGASTTNGFLRYIRDKLYAVLGAAADAAITSTATGTVIGILKALFLKGKVSRVSVTGITTTAATYSAGYCVGGKLTFTGVLRTGVESGIVQFVGVDMISARSTGMSLWLFNSDPTSSTITDNAAFIFHKDDVLKRVGIVPLSLTGVATASGTNGIQSVYTSGPIAMPIDNTTGGVLYGVLVADIATTIIVGEVQKITISALAD